MPLQDQAIQSQEQAEWVNTTALRPLHCRRHRHGPAGGKTHASARFILNSWRALQGHLKHALSLGHTPESLAQFPGM